LWSYALRLIRIFWLSIFNKFLLHFSPFGDVFCEEPTVTLCRVCRV
jgi:hypothetical protein